MARIGFIGVGGTGKSTLATFISQTYGWPTNPVGARSTAKAMGFFGPDGGRPFQVDRALREAYEDALGIPGTTTGEAALAAQIAFDRAKLQGFTHETCRPMFQARLAADKIAWEASAESFVTDRTPFDDAGYAFLHCPAIVTREFIARASRGLDRYDHLFFCPLHAGQWLEGDPAREGDPDYYVRLETAILGFFARDHHPFEIVTSPDLDARKRQVCAAIDRLSPS